MACARFGNQGVGRLTSSASVLKSCYIKSCWLEEELGCRLASHALATTSSAAFINEHRTAGTGAHHAYGACHSFAQPSANPTVRQFHSSSQASVASHRAGGPPLQPTAVAPILATVLEKALRDQFPLGPHPQVGPSLLTASLADLLTALSQSPAAASETCLPVRHRRPLAGSQQEAPGSALAAEQQPPQQRAKKKTRKAPLDPNLHKTGMWIKAGDVEELKQALREKLGWHWSPFLNKSFDIVEEGAVSPSTGQLLPPVPQIMESVDCLVACFSTLNAQQVVRNFLLRCPQLLAAPRAQLEASLGFLDFLNLSTEEMASCLERRPSLLLEDLETRLFPLCEYLDSIGIPPEQQRLIIVKRPHVMVQPLEVVRGVMAFLVGHGVEGAALTQVVTSAKGLLSISRPVLATRMRMLKDHLAGNALDVTRYPEYLMQRTWRVGCRVALIKHHGRQVLMPSQVDQATWDKALRKSEWVKRTDVPIPLPKFLNTPLSRVCQGLQIPLAKGMAFVDEWEAENGGKWSETPAETASMSQHAAVEAGAERMGPGVAGGEFAHHRELAEIYADADDVIDDVESDTALPGLV